MNKMIYVGSIAIALLAGCSDNASFEATEVQRGIANDNSRFNAQKWRGENGYEALGILTRGDSSQQPSCIQGDGWASVDLVDPKTKQPVVKLKCSTVSVNIGCVADADFKSRPVLAQQEGHCNPNIPANLKKIEN